MRRPARRPAWAARPRAAAGAALAALLTVPLAAGPGAASATTGVTTGLNTGVSTGVSTGLNTGVSTASTPPARVLPSVTEDVTTGLRIVVDDVHPTVAVIGEPVQLRGRVVNTSDEGRRLTRITADAAWTPLTQREEVDAWVEGLDRRTAGWELAQALLGPVVAPGSEVPFTLTVAAEHLEGLPAAQAVLGLELSVDNSADTSRPEDEPADDGALATARTVLTVTRDVEVTQPLGLSWLVPLTLPADADLSTPDDERRRAAWLEVAGPDGAARTWLSSFTMPGITWMVDPALLATPHPRPTLLGETAPGDGQPTEETPTGEEPPTGDDPGPTPPADEVGDDPSATSLPPPGGGDASDTTDAGPAATEDGPVTADAEEVTTPPEPDTQGPDIPEPPGQGDGAAGAVEADLDALRDALTALPEEQLWWLPTDDPDLAALLAVSPTPATGAAVADAMSRAPQGPAGLAHLLRQGRDDVAWPLLSGPDAAALSGLQSLWDARASDRAAAGGSGREPAGLAAVILPRESVTGATPASLGRAAVPLAAPQGLTALTTDTRSSALLAAAADEAADAGAGAAAQRLLADSLTAWAEEPQLDRSMLVAPPRGTVPDPAVLAELQDGVRLAPWIRPQSSSALLSQTSESPVLQLTGGQVDPALLGDLAPYAQVPESPITTRTARALSGLRADLTGLEQVLTRTEGVRSWEPTVASLFSTRWRADHEPWEAIWRGVRDESEALRGGVSVNPSTINFLSDEGVMRVTVVNTLPVQIENLHVRVVPGTTILQVTSQPEPVTIGANSRATVSFGARAVTRGQTTVTAELTAPNGTTFGDSATVDVRVQPTGVWIYWVLGGIAGVLVVLGVVRALRSAPRVPPSTSTDPRSTSTDPRSTGRTQEHP